MSSRRRGILLHSGAIIILMAAGAAIGHLSTRWEEPLYSSTTTLLVGDITAGPALSEKDLNASSQTTARYRELIRGQPVLGPVSDLLYGEEHWQSLKDQVHVEAGANGLPFLYVAVYASTPRGAQVLGEAVAEQVVQLGVDVAEEPREAASQVAAEKAAKLEAAINRAEARISRLEEKLRRARSARGLVLLQARVNDEADLIIGWQESYAAALSSIPGSPDRVQVLMPASSNWTRLGPGSKLRTGLGAVLGALAGGFLFFPHSGSIPSRLHRRRYVSGETFTSPRGTHARRRPRLDPWIRESLPDLTSQAGTS